MSNKFLVSSKKLLVHFETQTCVLRFGIQVPTHQASGVGVLSRAIDLLRIYNGV